MKLAILLSTLFASVYWTYAQYEQCSSSFMEIDHSDGMTTIVVKMRNGARICFDFDGGVIEYEAFVHLEDHNAEIYHFPEVNIATQPPVHSCCNDSFAYSVGAYVNTHHVLPQSNESQLEYATATDVDHSEIHGCWLLFDCLNWRFAQLKSTIISWVKITEKNNVAYSTYEMHHPTINFTLWPRTSNSPLIEHYAISNPLPPMILISKFDQKSDPKSYSKLVRIVSPRDYSKLSEVAVVCDTLDDALDLNPKKCNIRPKIISHEMLKDKIPQRKSGVNMVHEVDINAVGVEEIYDNGEPLNGAAAQKGLVFTESEVTVFMKYHTRMMKPYTQPNPQCELKNISFEGGTLDLDKYNSTILAVVGKNTASEDLQLFCDNIMRSSEPEIVTPESVRFVTLIRTKEPLECYLLCRYGLSSRLVSLIPPGTIREGYKGYYGSHLHTLSEPNFKDDGLFGDLSDVISEAWGKVKDMAASVGSYLASIPSKIKEFMSSLFGTICNIIIIIVVVASIFLLIYFCIKSLFSKMIFG